METLIVWPMVVTALSTLLLYIPMSLARIAGIKAGKAKASDYKLIQTEPEESLKFSNAIRNQYETPVLFYVACIAAFMTGNAGIVIVSLAWIYALLKLAHVYSHVTANNLRHRRPVFMAAWIILIIMWLVLAVHLTGIA